MDSFIMHLSTILETSPEQISPASELDRFPMYDSLGLVAIIAMIDQEYGKQVKADDIRKAKTVKDLFEVVQGVA